VVAEGAKDKHGIEISSDHVKNVLQEKLGEESRLTVLGHVQRGGSPSAFDRILGARLGAAAVDEIASSSHSDEPILIGLRGNRITKISLKQCIQKTQEINEAIKQKEYAKAMELRGKSFIEAYQIFRTMIRSLPHEPQVGQKRLRLAIIHSGALAPGMNTAVRAAVRLGLDAGHIMLGIFNGFQGFASGQIKLMDWMSVKGWAHRGGSELGTNRKVPSGSDLYAIARNIEEHQIQGLLVIGGLTGYQAAYKLFSERKNFPSFNIPIVCMPASINNNLPGSELSLGADTALNNIINAVDKIKQSAIAERRCFIVEVMGRYCGYLALMTGLATGAERVYLNEEGVSLKDLQRDLEILKRDFSSGKRLGLLIRNENANPIYTTSFMRALFEEEGGELFDARQVILGHLQRGGDPSPFDRIQATRLAAKSISHLIDLASHGSSDCAFIGFQGKEIVFHNLEDFPRMVDEVYQRPKVQWWLEFRELVENLSHYHEQ
jgi:6-phosphofructokinase 1